MSYVQRVLQQGETVLHTASIHWVSYLPGLIVLLCAIVVFAVAEGALQPATNWKYTWLIVAAILGLIALYQLAWAWWEWWTTEIAVTNRRIIYKEGFIRRTTVEMHMDKVESVDVDQSILGRLLDYGDIIVKGTGTGFEPLKQIAAPLDLRNHITGI